MIFCIMMIFISLPMIPMITETLPNTRSPGKNNRGKNNQYIGLWITPEEKEIWTQHADSRHITLTAFIRRCIDQALFHPDGSTNTSYGEEMKQLQEEVITLSRKLNLDLPGLLSQIAQIKNNIDQRPLEEKINSQLQGRSLFLNQLATYCQESPEIVLSVLSRMSSVMQDSQMRWKLK